MPKLWLLQHIHISHFNYIAIVCKLLINAGIIPKTNTHKIHKYKNKQQQQQTQNL